MIDNKRDRKNGYNFVLFDTRSKKHCQGSFITCCVITVNNVFALSGGVEKYRIYIL